MTRNAIPLGYVEAKNIGTNLDDEARKKQLRRYTKSLDNLIFTDYLEFRLYRGNEQTTTVRIAELSGNRIKPAPNNFQSLTDLLTAFAGYQGQTIRALAAICFARSAAVVMVSVIKAALEKENDSFQSEVHKANDPQRHPPRLCGSQEHWHKPG